MRKIPLFFAVTIFQHLFWFRIPDIIYRRAGKQTDFQNFAKLDQTTQSKQTAQFASSCQSKKGWIKKSKI